MSLKKIVTAATIAVLSAGSLLPLASAASAGEWNKHGHGGPRVESRGFENHGFGGHEGNHRWRGYNAYEGYEGGYHRHRNHDGRALAIGAFATILGLAIAAEAGRDHHDYDSYSR